MTRGRRSIWGPAAAGPLSALVLVMCAGAAPASEPGAHAAGGYRPCGAITVKGHGRKVFAYKMSCRNAKSKSRYVLKTFRSPRGWRCSLSSVRRGTGGCSRGSATFTFVPRT